MLGLLGFVVVVAPPLLQEVIKFIANKTQIANTNSDFSFSCDCLISQVTALFSFWLLIGQRKIYAKTTQLNTPKTYSTHWDFCIGFNNAS